MKDVLLFLYLAAILFSAVMAIIHRKHLETRGLFILVPYLFYVAIQELFLFFYLHAWPGSPTGIIYNIYKPVTVLVFAYLYYRIPFNAGSRNLIRWLVFLYLILTTITFIFIASIFKLNGYLTVAGGFVITCLGIIFLFNYFKLDNTTEERHWRPIIWITIGIVVFYPVINIAWAFHNPLVTKQATFFGFKLYQLMPQFMSIFMYSCFAYAFHLCKKKN